MSGSVTSKSLIDESHLVVYVGNVHDKINLESEVIAHNPSDNVGSDIIPGMT